MRDIDLAGIDLDQRAVEAMCRRSPAFFASERLIGDPDPPWRGRFIVARHHEEWSDLVAGRDRVCITASRGHGKSQFFTLALPLWDANRVSTAGLDPPDCVIFSASQRQAARLLKKIQAQVEKNPKLAHLLPSEADRRLWSTTGLQLANGYTIVASGYGTKVRGGHPRLIIVDDGFNDNSAYSELVRAKEIDYYFQAIRPMVMPGGKIVVVGTPLHRSDLYSRLMKNPEYVSRRYPAFVDEDGHPSQGEPLWPEVFDRAALQAIEREIGSLRFSREYLCNPVGEGSSLYPRRLFEQLGMERPDLRLGLPLERWTGPEIGIKLVAVGVDFGLSASIGSDYTVIWVMGVDAFGTRWIMDIYRENALSYTEQKQLIVHAARRYKADIVYCEANQAQRIYGEELQRQTDLPIQLHHTGDNKHSQAKGLPSIRILLENQKYRLPTGCSRSQELIGAWIAEMGGITIGQGKVVSLSDHDDLPMANWICERAISDGCFGFSFQEQVGDQQAYDDLITTVAPSAEDLDDDSFVLGAETGVLGGPTTINARLVDGSPQDVLRETEPEGNERIVPETGRRADGTPAGYPFGAPPPQFFSGWRR